MLFKYLVIENPQLGNNRYFCRRNILTMQENSGNKVDKYIHQLELRDVVDARSPGLYDKMPGLLKRYLRKITHIEELNRIFVKAQGKRGVEFTEVLLEEFSASVSAKGLENISKDKKIMVVANHPLGGFDGMALFNAVSQVRRDILIPANDFLMHLENLRDHFIPVNKLGSNTSNVRKMEEAFRSDNVVIMFPAGICSRKNDGVICDLEWKKTFITKAKNNKRDIVPVYIEGHNSKRFYRLAKIRKFFRIKFNIEMMFLVDEAYKLKDKNIKMIFGKPISYTVFHKKYKDVEWAQKVKDHVYKIRDDSDVIFDG